MLRTRLPRFALPILALPFLVCIGGACSLLFEASQGDEDAGDTGGAIDAGVMAVGCETRPTLEPFTAASLACGETELRLQLAEVPAHPGVETCPLTALRWQLIRHVGETAVELFSYQGAPADVLHPEAHVLGGTYLRPKFNLTSYHGPTVGQVAIKTKGAGTDQLFQRLLGISDDAYRMRVTLATSDSGFVKTNLIRAGSNGSVTYGVNDVCLGDVQAPCTTSTSFTTFVEEFVTEASEATPLLQFKLGDVGTYYFDNISITRVSDGQEVVREQSFPASIPVSLWSVNCVGDCEYSVVPIPDALAEYGSYTISLTAINAGGIESEARNIEFLHAPCFDP